MRVCSVWSATDKLPHFIEYRGARYDAFHLRKIWSHKKILALAYFFAKTYLFVFLLVRLDNCSQAFDALRASKVSIGEFFPEKQIFFKLGRSKVGLSSTVLVFS